MELKTRVEELKMENEYQLRLKDMNYNDKIKELSEKFIQEIEALKTKNQVGLRFKDFVQGFYCHIVSVRHVVKLHLLSHSV